MSPSLWWVIFTAILSPTLAIILKHLLQSYGKPKARMPPGPIGWPLLGSTMSLLKPHPITTLGDFMETQISKYGRIFSIGFAGERTVISTDPELTRFVLHNEVKFFENNTPKHMLTLFGKTGLGFLRGDEYRFKKSIVHAFINSLEPQTLFLDRAELAAARQMSAWKDKDVIYMAEETSRFSFHLIVELVTGVSPDHPQIEQLRKDVITFHNGTSVLPINLPGTCFRQALEAKARISNFFQQIIKEREVDTKKTVRDVIDRFMMDSSFTREEISMSAILLIFAGLYTTGNTLAVAIYFLQKCPKAVEQLREEIQRFVKSKENGKLAWDDYKIMYFTQSVTNEALRIGNVAPTLFKRALKDIEFKGFLIPKGTPILPFMAAGHLDPSVFENPGEFNPWRWLDKDGMKKHNSWMPFGGGLRYCNGRDIARIEIAVFLHHLVLHYDWEPTEPDEPIATPLVKFPKGFPIRIHARDSKI